MEHPLEQFEAFQQAIDGLERAGIDYALTGSWVISAYGIVRATHALDVVIALPSVDPARLAAAFPTPRYYADETWIAEAIVEHAFFNIIDSEALLKIDFWPLNEDAYSQEQFRRRIPWDMSGRRVWILTPEDILLAKLLWIKISDSERQWRDVRSV